MYRYLFFDLDGTLFDFLAAEKQAIIAMGDALGLPIGAEEVALYSQANLAAWRAFERGELGIEELKISRFEAFAKSTGLFFDPREASERYERALSEHGILYPESVSILETLSARGYTLYVATNGLAEVQRGRIAKAGVGHYFAQLFISEEMKTQKPEAAYFTMMLEKTGLTERRAECLMIGDTLFSDIAGALGSGIDTLWLNPHNASSGTLEPTYTVAHLSEILALLPPLMDRVELDL